MSNIQKRLDYFFILLIITATLLALLFKIGEIPPQYPWSDESEIAADAVATLKHGPQLFYPGQLAGGSLAVWLEAGWMALFGRSLIGLRLLNGLVNLATAVMIYLLVRQLPVGVVPEKLSTPNPQHLTALTASLLFAGSTWLLGLGRIATPNWSLMALMSTLAFYFFWRGLNERRKHYLLLCGAVLGLMFYGYIPGYFAPLVPVLFLIAAWLINNQYPKGTPLSISNTQRALRYQLPTTKFPILPTPRAASLLPFLTTLLIAAPMLIFFALNPTAALQRPLQLADTNELSPGSSMWLAGVDMLSTFGLYPNWLVQGRVEHLAFDPLVTVLFVIGMLAALWRWRVSGNLFLLIWWSVMITPALLSRSASLDFIFEVWRRGVGAQPVSFMLAAVGLQALVHLSLSLFSARTQRSGRAELSGSISTARFTRSFVYPLLIVLVVSLSAGLSYWLYFVRWANSGALSTLFAKQPVQLVQWLESHSDAQTAFIFPIRPNVSPTTRPELFTVRYLYNGPAAIIFPMMDEQPTGDTLAELLQSQPATVSLMLSRRVPVDPKGYFQYALGLRGGEVEQEQLPDYQVTTYQMQADASILPELTQADVRFGDRLRLTGQQVEGDPLTAGQSLSVALRWQAEIELAADYSASLLLVDSQGFEVAKIDKPLLSSGNYLTTRHWTSGRESTQYYTLPIPPDTPPGKYQVSVTAYNTETGVPLPPAGGQPDLSLPLATVAVQPTAAVPARLEIPQPLDITFPGGVSLRGVDASAAKRPGEMLRVSLWWQAGEQRLENIGLLLALAQPDNEPVPLMTQPQPLIEGYPTPEWPPGSTYRANYRLLLPATLAEGDYSLVLRLVNLNSGEPLAEQLLSPISVEAREHRFEAPPLANQPNVNFGDVIRLRSFEISGAALEPGQTVQVKVQWQALREMSESYKIFLHLTDEAGHIISQTDILPQQGNAPTTGWVSGEIIEDELNLTIPPALSVDTYRLVIGLYNEASGQRLEAGEHGRFNLIEMK